VEQVAMRRIRVSSAATCFQDLGVAGQEAFVLGITEIAFLGRVLERQPVAL
jgi:hypothetical protein